jgi:hypothetical protein
MRSSCRSWGGGDSIEGAGRLVGVKTLSAKLRAEARLRLEDGSNAADVSEDSAALQLLQLRLELLCILAADNYPRAIAVVRGLDGGYKR